MAVSDWRITVERINRSQTLVGQAINTGAMGLRSKRKRMEPVFINANDENKILDLYGQPTTEFPDVWEAIQYNRAEGIWLFSPTFADDKVGGALVTASGITALSTGLDPANPSYTFTEDVGGGEGQDEYFVIYSKWVVNGGDDLSVTMTYDDEAEPEQFTITVYKSGEEMFSEQVSLIPGTRNGFGANIYIEDVLENNEFVGIMMNENRSFTSFTDVTTAVTFGGNEIDSAGDMSVAMTNGWDQFQQANKYPFKVGMDTTADPAIADSFSTLRNSYQSYARFILPLPLGENTATAIATKTGLGVNNYGLAFYWNQGRVRNNYAGGSFWTSLVGRIGAKYAIMSDIFNAGSPSYEDRDGYGGQLGTGIIELQYDPSNTELRQLDDAGINPVVFEPGAGVLIAGDKTAQNPKRLDDYSYIPHVGLFDYLIENIVTFVLKPQRNKLNNPVNREIAANLTNGLISPVQAATFLRDYVVVCDRSNNTDDVLARREFVLTVVVQVTPFSQKLRLKFANIGQTTTVEQFFD